MYIYSLLTFVLVLLFGIMPKLSNKNKMRVKMLSSGILNQIVLLAIIVLLMYENIPLGLSLLLVFVSAVGLKLDNDTIVEYFSSN
jgi:hypothetical protein